MAKKADGTDDGLPEVTEIVFVTMVRDPEFYDEPHSAQVHPDEVKNYYPGGWSVKAEEAK